MTINDLKESMQLDNGLTEKVLTGFLKDSFQKAGSKKAIIGLSGGLDSSVAAYLAVKALGKENVHGVMMPYKTSAKASLEDAELIVKELGITAEVVEISPMADPYFEISDGIDPLRKGNVMARCRMIVLYDLSAKLNGLVVGTSNKTEIMLGYGTIFGDMACAVNPIGDIYKTQERDLALHLGVSEKILSKVPTADLVEGQTDESDLGFTYADVDPMLFAIVEKRYSREKVIELGYKEEFVDTVAKRISRNHYKRIPPLIAKVSECTVGHEFRYAWDWSSV